VVPGVNRFAVGDEVYGMPLFPRAASAYAELVAAPAWQLSRTPRTLRVGQHLPGFTVSWPMTHESLG
jgi:NADPH:quinone reductase-like Zn-dependent oxidoreductase